MNAPVVGTVSSVSTTTKKRCVAASYRQLGSVTNWPADARRAVDRRRVAVERVQVDGVVHVAREAADDVRGGVVGQHRVTRRVEDVEDVVDGLDDVAVADAQPLVGRLDRELVPAARVALLVEVQALEARDLNCGFDFAFLPLLMVEPPPPVPSDRLRLTIRPP